MTTRAQSVNAHYSPWQASNDINRRTSVSLLSAAAGVESKWMQATVGQSTTSKSHFITFANNNWTVILLRFSTKKGLWLIPPLLQWMRQGLWRKKNREGQSAGRHILLRGFLKELFVISVQNGRRSTPYHCICHRIGALNLSIKI